MILDIMLFVVSTIMIIFLIRHGLKKFLKTNKETILVRFLVLTLSVLISLRINYYVNQCKEQENQKKEIILKKEKTNFFLRIMLEDCKYNLELLDSIKAKSGAHLIYINASTTYLNSVAEIKYEMLSNYELLHEIDILASQLDKINRQINLRNEFVLDYISNKNNEGVVSSYEIGRMIVTTKEQIIPSLKEIKKKLEEEIRKKE